jgi:hypothetical protein
MVLCRHETALGHRPWRPSGSGSGLHIGVERRCGHEEVDAHQTSHGSQLDLIGWNHSQLDLIGWNH